LRLKNWELFMDGETMLKKENVTSFEEGKQYLMSKNYTFKNFEAAVVHLNMLFKVSNNL
jgi:pterin-4a-carbinolamine dehydratase